MPAAENPSSRLLFKFATAVQEFGPNHLERHLDSLISRKNVPNSERIKIVVEVVSKTLNITQSELKIGTSEEATFGLFVTYYLIKTKALPSLSQKEIAKYFNRKSHSCVNRGIKFITDLNPQKTFEKKRYDQVREIERRLDEKLKSI